MGKRGWAVVLCACVACVSQRGAFGPPPCDPVTGANCVEAGPPLTDEQRAEIGFGDECAHNVIDSCVRLGRLLIQEGKLNEAEVPLRKAYRDEDQEGTVALAELYEARGDPEGARRFRWEAPAIDKANSETTVWYRPGYPQGQGAAFTVNLQPMVFFARRFDIGFEMAFVEHGISEVDGFAGYQHFFSETVVGYAQVLLGGLPLAGTGTLNFGADCGVKLSLGSIGGIAVGFGGSRGSPIHAQVGLTFNSLIWLIPLALAAH